MRDGETLSRGRSEGSLQRSPSRHEHRRALQTTGASKSWPRTCRVSEVLNSRWVSRCAVSCPVRANPIHTRLMWTEPFCWKHDVTRSGHALLVAARRCRLVVVAIETGGRWSEEAVEFTTQLAFAKAREVPAYMHWPAVYAWQRRWTRMLSTVCALSFTASLVDPPAQCETWCSTGGEAPNLAELFSQDPRYSGRQFCV